MQNHPAVGDIRFAAQFLDATNPNLGPPPEPPRRGRQLVRRLRQSFAIAMHKWADRIEARPVCQPTISDCEG